MSKKIMLLNKKKTNLCEQEVSRPRPSMSMDDLLNHFYNCTIEQRTARNTILPNTEPKVPSDEFLEITKRFYSDAIDQPFVDQK
jgi:hypothetical protein